MPVDTSAKRRSALRRLLTPYPAPDGTVDPGDEQQVLWLYRGITARILMRGDYRSRDAALRSVAAALVSARAEPAAAVSSRALPVAVINDDG